MECMVAKCFFAGTTPKHQSVDGKGDNSHLSRIVAVPWYSLNFGEVPLFVAERTHTSSFQPPLDTIQVKNVPAVSESYTESILVVGRGIRLSRRERLLI